MSRWCCLSLPVLESRKLQPPKDQLGTAIACSNRPIIRAYPLQQPLPPNRRIIASPAAQNFLSLFPRQRAIALLTPAAVTVPRRVSKAPSSSSSSSSRSSETYLSRRGLTTTTAAAKNMASDEDYMAFLDKANQDPYAGVAKTQGQGQGQGRASEMKPFRTTQEGVEIPAPLVRAVKDAFYVSDADEPFEAFALGWDEGGKGLPDEGSFDSELSWFFRSRSSLVLWGVGVEWLTWVLGEQRSSPS
ncbi:hypothetical protein VTK56DRAFT_4553 [Thermocarpiscus australiensis]